MTSLTTGPALAGPDAQTDAALAGLAAVGDVAAFEALYRRHVGMVHGLIVRLVGAQGVRAQDLTQESFIRAWQGLPAFRFESAVTTWLHRLAVTTALMELRTRRTSPRLVGDDEADETAQFGSADSAGGHTALRMDLERAVATLPPRARAVLVLHDVEGWKHEEVAAMLGMAVGSSKAQLHRARRLLRARMGDHA